MQVQKQEASKRAETKITLSNQSSAGGLSEDNSLEPSRLFLTFTSGSLSQTKDKKKKDIPGADSLLNSPTQFFVLEASQVNAFVCPTCTELARSELAINPTHRIYTSYHIN